MNWQRFLISLALSDGLLPPIFPADYHKLGRNKTRGVVVVQARELYASKSFQALLHRGRDIYRRSL